MLFIWYDLSKCKIDIDNFRKALKKRKISSGQDLNQETSLKRAIDTPQGFIMQL